MEITKHDWKLFQGKVGGWQSRYLDRLCREYAELLAEDRDASERFWELDKRIRKDRKSPGVRIEMTKDMMVFDIVALIRNEAITTEDLDGFSAGLRETVARVLSL